MQLTGRTLPAAALVALSRGLLLRRWTQASVPLAKSRLLRPERTALADPELFGHVHLHVTETAIWLFV
jgi:hypothetical protein